MTVFDVFLNNRKLCRAGVGRDGVLNAIVNWVRLTGDAAQTARRLKQPLEDVWLQVGGLRQDTHLRWSQRMLKIGDRVTIAVARSRTWDAPEHQKRDSPAERRRQERRYYLHLKEKYERRGSAPAKRQVENDARTTFLNVDLDLWSATSLDPLIHALGRRVIVLHAGKEGRRYRAHLELAAMARDADRVIHRFVTLVDGLPRAARASWNRAQSREFNIGIQAAAKPHQYDVGLRPETVRAMARINARLGVTVYAAET